MTENRLASLGGPKVRETPFPNVNDVSGRFIGDEELALVTEVIRSGSLFRMGAADSKVRQLEQNFAAWLGVPHVAASTSGTASIHLAIAALDPEPGDEIIVTPITDWGSIAPILSQNAVPVFADVDPRTYCIDPAAVERVITPRTRAILAVHLFGQPADIDGLLAVARRHNLPLIEDCSQAHGATYRGQKVGTFGDIACFSLQQSKQMTAGEGGLTATRNAAWATRMRLFSDKGWQREGSLREHLFLGLNYRMSELQGAVALAQLGKVDRVVALRQRAAGMLDDLIADLPGLSTPDLPPDSRSACWLFPINVDTARLGVPVATIVAALNAEGLPAGAGYVKPMHLVPALREGKTYGTSGFPFNSPYTTRTVAEFAPGLCPVAEAMDAGMMTLPINEKFTDDDVRDLATGVRKVIEHFAGA